MAIKRRIKRTVIRGKIKARKKRATRHQKEMTKLGIARNKALKEAAIAAEKAEALEKKRKAEEKKAKAIEPLKTAQKRARAQRATKAKKLTKDTIKSFEPIYQFIKGKK